MTTATEQQLAQHSYRPFYHFTVVRPSVTSPGLSQSLHLSGGRLQQRLFLSLQISNLASPPHPIFLFSSFSFCRRHLFFYFLSLSLSQSLSVSLTSFLSHILFIFSSFLSSLFLPLSQNHIPFPASAASPSEHQLLFPGCRSIPHHSR